MRHTRQPARVADLLPAGPRMSLDTVRDVLSLATPISELLATRDPGISKDAAIALSVQRYSRMNTA